MSDRRSLCMLSRPVSEALCGECESVVCPLTCSSDLLSHVASAAAVYKHQQKHFSA